MEDSTMLNASQPLFHELTFTIILNSLPEIERQKLAETITNEGGTVKPFDASKGHIDELEGITHIISTTSDFPDYHRALDLFIHVVKPTWVDACRRINKVKNPRAYSPDTALFMSEVVVCCGNIPEGDKEAIEGGILATGGQYTPALSKQVTHIIALNLEDPRCQLAVAKNLHCTMLLPHWFDDCLKVGRRISERPYKFDAKHPYPELLDVTAGAIPTSRPSPQILEAANPEPTSDPFPPSLQARLEPPRAIQAFNGKKVMLGSDLPLSSRLKGVITELVQSGGGEITTSVDRADMYVCNYRDGPDYIKASQAKKDVGNLGWLYYMITHNTWTDPMRRMLHYPRPREGILGFKKYKISISSYTGEARVYLENLVKATGAEFTKTFKQDNTHLITAHKQSEKCEAAQEWGVHVINHLWVEDSYAKCKEQTLTDPRYTYFPPRTNLGDVLGQTSFDRDAVEKFYFSKGRNTKSAKSAAPQVDAPASSAPRRITSDSNARSSPLAEKTRRTKSAADETTPVAPRHLDGKENETPGTTGSRGAKDRALSKLHDAAPDIAKFEKEMKRKGGVIRGGRRDKEAEVAEKSKTVKGRDSNASKRSFDELDVDEEGSEEDLTEDAAKKSKKAKTGKMPPIQYRMLVSKDQRWENNSDKESKDKARMREIGLYITDDSRRVDLLCAPKIVRTKKFVSALACAPTVVSTSYLDYALKHNKLPPPEKHLLHDREFEKQHKFRLHEALERAKQNKNHLLRDWTIFCTEKVTGGFETYKDIILANGGQCHMWKGRTTNITAAKRSIDPVDKDAVSQNQEEDEGDVLYLISEPNKAEFGLWTKFRELAEKHDMVPRIVKTEWLLYVAMAQYVHWKPEWELNEEIVKAMK